MQARPAILQKNKVVLNQSGGMVYSSPFAPFVNALTRQYLLWHPCEGFKETRSKYNHNLRKGAQLRPAGERHNNRVPPQGQNWVILR
jgi:hypothetical protein